MKRSLLRTRPIAVAVSCCFASSPVFGNPTGAQIVGGVVTIQRPDAKTLNVTNSPGSVINWQGFSIGAGEVTRFIQQSSSSAVLNRVVGADISQISGQLLSNGRVFLINPAGIVIGGGAIVDTAGFVGSTLNMLDSDFIAGKLKFQGDANSGSIINQGWIKTSSGGNVILVAPSIENSGVIQAENGQIILAAGQKVTIGSLEYEGVQFEVQAPTDSVLNIGKLLADGGAVGVFAGTLKHTGDIRANALTRDEAGHIVLKAQADTILAGNSTITATGTKGGSVQVLGNRVGVTEQSSIEVSGEKGGGTILIGGDYRGSNPLVLNAWRTFVGPEVTLKADAITSGEGGKVIVWADDITRAYGAISARGGALSGNGGFVETSGKQWLDFSAAVDTSAPNGARGTLLLDPKFLEVNNAGGAAYSAGTNNLFGNNATGTSIITATSINGQTSNVTLEANTDLTFTSPITMTTGGVQLTGRAGRSIFVNADITTSNANINLTANSSAATAGNRDAGDAQFTMAAGRTINAGTGIVTILMDTGVTGATAGNMVVANLTGNSVSVEHNGTPAVGNTGSILAADTNSLLSVANNGSVHIEIDTPAGGATSSIGTSASPLRIMAAAVSPGVPGTAILESHYHGGGSGIYFDALSNVQIGGASTAVFPAASLVRGLQALNQNGGASGPVQLNATGTITQQTGGAVCGANSGNQTGGPICAGTTFGLGVSAFQTRNGTITLRANDMTLQSEIKGTTVTLLPNANGTISPGTASGTFASLYLTQAELNQITASTLQIGGRTANGDSATSGDITFAAGGIQTPQAPGGGVTTLEFRTGTNMNSGGGTDITTNNANLLLKAGQIGATGASRLKVNPGTGTVNTLSTVGGTFIQQGPTGDLTLSNYGFSLPSGTPLLEYTTTDGNINAANTTLTGGNINLSLITQGATRNISFSGTGSFDAVSVTTTPSGFTLFTGGTQTFSTSTFNSIRPVIFNGGNAVFGRAATLSTTNGRLTINSASSTATFNTASTIAGAGSLSAGALAGTGSVAFNNGLTWSGGTISNTGAVTVSGGATLNTGPLQLNGSLSVDTFALAGATQLNIANGAVLTMSGTGASTTSAGSQISNSGTMTFTGVGGISMNGSLITNNNNGLIDFRTNASLLSAGGSPGVINNGILRKSTAAGTTAIGSAANPVTFSNSGTLDAQIGNIQYGGTNTFANGTIFNGTTDSHHVLGNSTFGNITSNSSSLILEGGNYSGGGTFAGTVDWTGGTMTGALTNAGTLNLQAGGARQITGVTFTNAGTGVMNIQNTSLQLNSATLQNNGMIDMQQAASIQQGGTANVINAGTLQKSGAGIAFFGAGVALSNASTGTIHLTQGSLQLNGALPNNDGIVNVDAGTTLFTGSAALTNRTTGTIMGNGQINLNAQTLTNDGVIAPGASPGTLTILGNFVQTANGTLSEEINGTTPGTGYDVLQVTGTAALNGTVHVLLGCGTCSTGNTFDVVTSNTPNGVTSAFANVNVTPPNATYTQTIVTGSPSALRLTQTGASSSSSSSGSSSSSSVNLTNNNNVLSDQNRMEQTLGEANNQPGEQPQQTRTRLSSERTCS